MNSGIYMWTSPSGKSYIGQSIDLTKRKNRFINNQYDKSQKKLKYALNKYNISTWKYQVLEYCEIDRLDEREIYYIKLYDTFIHGYNMTKGGMGTLGHKMTEEGKEKNRQVQKERIHTELERQKKSESLKRAYKDGRKKANPDTSHLHTDEIRDKRAKSLIGRILSEETKKKISDAHKGKIPWNKSIPMSEEQREKLKQVDRTAISGVNNYHAKKVIQLDMNGNFIKEWGCIMDAKREYGSIHIEDVCQGKRKTAGGFIWEYKKEDD